MSLREELNQYEPKCIRGLGLPIDVWEWAGGAWISDGKQRFLDFTSGGLMVAVCGHGDLCSSLNVYGRISTYFTPTRERLRAYQALKRMLPPYLDRYLMTVTSGEAVETACRIACDLRKRSIRDVARAKDSSYNGNLVGINLTARCLQEGHGPNPQAHALLLCPFEGPTCRWWSDDFIAKVREWQSRGGIVIFDECQGFARTGKWSGFEWYDIEPDMVVYGKGIAGGLPMSVVAGRHEIMDAVTGDYTSTHSGHAMACASLAQTVEWIETYEQLAAAAVRGEQVERWAAERGYRRQGRGLAQALLVGDKAGAVIDACARERLLLLDTRAAGTVKIAPPLCITSDDLQQGLDIIERAIAKEASHG